jgi:hypothetical protein
MAIKQVSLEDSDNQELSLHLSRSATDENRYDCLRLFLFLLSL